MPRGRQPPPRPASKPGAQPAPKPAARPVPHLAPKPADKPVPRDTRAPGKKEEGRAAGAGGSQDFSGGLTGTAIQQELEALKGEVGSLNFGRTWQGANPPKIAGTYGLALQSVEVGNNLRTTGKVFSDGCAKVAATSARIPSMVKAHKPPAYEVKK